MVTVVGRRHRPSGNPVRRETVMSVRVQGPEE